ncbi:MAG: hypothetical protein FJ100_23890, partial [Deltaproteobacteria bacterium]|nr:hypothetical protein [Deltaproteobacteria bacterium]
MTTSDLAMLAAKTAEALVAVQALATLTPAAAHLAVARKVLDDSDVTGGAEGDEAQRMLAEALCRAWPGVVEALVGATASPVQHGRLALDVALATWFDGQNHPHRAAKLREYAAYRFARYSANELELAAFFRLWESGAVGAAVAVARTIWDAQVSEEWRGVAKRFRARPPALVASVASDLAVMGRASVAADGHLSGADGAPLMM